MSNKTIRLIKSNWKNSETEHYISFVPQFNRLHIAYNSWGYFDSRPYIHIQLSTIVIFVLSFIISPLFLLGLFLRQ